MVLLVHETFVFGTLIRKYIEHELVWVLFYDTKQDRSEV